jgi:hypothetical protein
MDKYIGWSGPELMEGAVEFSTLWLTKVFGRRVSKVESGWDGEVVGYPGGRFVISFCFAKM